MSYCADFIFNIPPRFGATPDFVEWLRSQVGIEFRESEQESSWTAAHLGLCADFRPNHGLEPDRDLPYDRYTASIGLTGYAGHGELRVIVLSAVINIGICITDLLEIDGIVVWNTQIRVAHFSREKGRPWLREFDHDMEIKSSDDLKPLLRYGVQY